MNTMITPEIKEVMNALHYRPAVSIIMPFEPKMGLKAELAYALKQAADKVERDLTQNYPHEISKSVMQKLRSIIKGLDFNMNKKSVAIYVSPVFEKVLYLDIAVEEKIIVDESFEIRDLVYSKKQMHKYLVLLLSAKESRIYLGNSTGLAKVMSDIPQAIEAFEHELPERVANFSDPSDRREILMEKFLHHTDQALDIVLHAYHLPVFIIGAERVLGHFKKATKHQDTVVDYIPGNYEKASLPELQKMLEPYITGWKKEQQAELLSRLEEAAGKRKLVTGMPDVWREAMHKNGRLLVVEKNYMYAAQHADNPDMIYPASGSDTIFSTIRDAVDDVIEKVLENGGDVEFTDTGLLKEYRQIALVQYY